MSRQISYRVLSTLFALTFLALLCMGTLGDGCRILFDPSVPQEESENSNEAEESQAREEAETESEREPDFDEATQREVEESVAQEDGPSPERDIPPEIARDDGIEAEPEAESESLLLEDETEYEGLVDFESYDETEPELDDLTLNVEEEAELEPRLDAGLEEGETPEGFDGQAVEEEMSEWTGGLLSVSTLKVLITAGQMYEAIALHNLGVEPLHWTAGEDLASVALEPGEGVIAPGGEASVLLNFDYSIFDDPDRGAYQRVECGTLSIDAGAAGTEDVEVIVTNFWTYCSKLGPDPLERCYWFMTTERIALKFVEGLPPEEVQTIISGEPVIAGVVPEWPWPQGPLVLLSTIDGATECELAGVVARMNQNPEVEYTSLVFRPPRTWVDMIPLGEVIVKFNENVSREQIDAINQAYGTEILRVLWENSFLLRVLEPKRVTSLEIANLYEESPLVEYADPNVMGGLNF